LLMIMVIKLIMKQMVENLEMCLVKYSQICFLVYELFCNPISKNLLLVKNSRRKLNKLNNPPSSLNLRQNLSTPNSSSLHVGALKGVQCMRQMLNKDPDAYNNKKKMVGYQKKLTQR